MDCINTQKGSQRVDIDTKESYLAASLTVAKLSSSLAFGLQTLHPATSTSSIAPS